MDTKEIPMVPNRRALSPKVYGDTPSFLGTNVLDPDVLEPGFDVLFSGVPWEGTLTWGSYAGCEQAPRAIRNASIRYGGYLPEYDIDLFDHLRVGDVGDVDIYQNRPIETMANVYSRADKIYKVKSLPFFLGGDHSFAPEVVRALSDNHEGEIGIIHFDSHFDNSATFGNDMCPRCGPIHRIAQIDKVRKQSIVHIGIRGPRNSPSQASYARSMGARIYTILEIRKRGIEAVMNEAINIAKTQTRHIYVTICSDCIDAAFNPGGPADFNGLFPYELLSALFQLGESGIAGLDYAEVYPQQDPSAFSSHLASWAIIHVLAGIASRKQNIQMSSRVPTTGSFN